MSSSSVTKQRGRPPKTKARCAWCYETSLPLKYVLPTRNEKKEFCSATCLAEFRKADSRNGNSNKVNANSSTSNNDVNARDTESPIKRRLSSSSYSKNANESTTIQHKDFPSPITAIASTATTNTYSFNEFDWETYLEKTNSEAAPCHFFKQYPQPPENKFEKDMILEAKDPRNLTSTCVVRVISKCGPRLLLRLEGADDKNDFWKLIDSKEIQAIGTAEKNDDMLQPPLGFRSNVAVFNQFLTKVLRSAKKAPQDVFVEEPPKPRCNYFKPGQKLEAVDMKNPHLICVATVGKVEEDDIFISFDGCKGPFGYSYKYYSRDLFPVGWCKKSGYPLHIPGLKNTAKHKGKIQGLVPATLTDNPVPTSHSVSNTTTQPQQLSLTNVTTSDVIDPRSPSLSDCVTLIEADTSSIITKSENSVRVFVNSECNCGPYLNRSQMSQIPLTFGPDTIKRVLRESVQHLVDASRNQKQVTDMLKQGDGKVIITAKHENESRHFHLPEIVEESEFWSFISNFLDDLRCCKNLYNKTSLTGPCPNCRNLSYSELQDTNKMEVKSKSCDSVAIGSSNNAVTTSPSIATKRKYLPSPTPESSTGAISSTSIAKKIRSVVAEQEAATSTTHAELAPKLPSDATKWSIENVISYISYSDPLLSILADLFRRHEIDGKALLLLNSDTMMKYMGLKLGPALKICNLVSKIKSRRHVIL